MVVIGKTIDYNASMSCEIRPPHDLCVNCPGFQRYQKDIQTLAELSQTNRNADKLIRVSTSCLVDLDNPDNRIAQVGGQGLYSRKVVNLENKYSGYTTITDRFSPPDFCPQIQREG